MAIGIWELIILAVLIVLVVVIFGPVVKKAGFARWWALVLFVPLINLIMIWAFAFMKWPAEKAHNNR